MDHATGQRMTKNDRKGPLVAARIQVTIRSGASVPVSHCCLMQREPGTVIYSYTFVLTEVGCLIYERWERGRLGGLGPVRIVVSQV